MDIAAYFDRIAYRGPLRCDAETLQRLQVAHLYAVPFENLSIHWGEQIELDDEALFDKVVRRRRGGFCYELNGLFAALLGQLGFEVEKLAGQVMGANGVYGQDFAHMALAVTLAERWLVDVGFGDSFVEPLRLDEPAEQPQGERAYLIDADGEGRRVLLRRDRADEWRPQYRFRLEPYGYADFAEMCHYQQTSPESHFTQSRICSLATPRGRVTLSQMRLITTEGSERRERQLADAEEAEQVLREVFGVVE